ncbi:MAG: hypothetical protein AAF865_01865 [Pseudomonadota bacterium]
MAKKKTPAELKSEGVELGEQITLARKRPVNFALQIGKEGLVLETDIKKGPDILWRNAKKNGGGPKGAMGTMTVKGKVIELTCADDSAPNQLPKLAKKWLNERGQAYKVIMITPSGEVGDEDEDDEALQEGAVAEAGAHEETLAEDAADDKAPADPTGDAEEETSGSGAETASGDRGGAAEDDPVRAEVSQEFEDLAEQIELAKRSVHKGAAKKATTLSETVGKLIEENPKKAAGMIKLLKKTVEDAVEFGVTPSAGVEAAGEAAGSPAGPDVAAQRKRAKALGGLSNKVSRLLAELA